MLLIRLKPNRAGLVVETFECSRCGESKIVETKDPFHQADGWLASRDLLPPD